MRGKVCSECYGSAYPLVRVYYEGVERWLCMACFVSEVLVWLYPMEED